MELEAWRLELGAWSLKLLSLFFCKRLDDARQKSLVFGVCNIFNGLVPAIPAALALAALIRRRACFILYISDGRRPGPCGWSCAIDFSC